MKIYAGIATIASAIGLGAGAMAQGQYPEAIALVDGELYYGEDRAGFDLPPGENPARYRFGTGRRVVYCETIPACESSIATALSKRGGAAGAASGDGQSQQELEKRRK